MLALAAPIAERVMDQGAEMAAWLQAIAALLTMVAAVAAAIIAAKAPERAAHFAEKRRADMAKEEDRRRFQYQILQALMKGRRSLLHADTIAALNLVDLAFHDAPRVRSAYRLFISTSVDGDAETLLQRYLDLLREVSTAVGMGEALHEDDFRLGYYPNALVRLDEAALADAEAKLAKAAGKEAQKPDPNAFDAFRTRD